MSWGYSCNLGFPIPSNWAYDQFYEELLPSTPSFSIDKVAYSGRDMGTHTFLKVELSPDKDVEYCNAKTEIARQKFIYEVLDPLKYWDKVISIGISYNRALPILSYQIGTIRIDVLVTISFEQEEVAENDWNIDISLDETGNLTAGCQNSIVEATKDIDLDSLGNGLEFKDALANIALSIKSGNIAMGVSRISDKQIKVFIRISTDNLEPKDKDIDQTISVEVDFVITLTDGSNFNEEAFSLASTDVLVGIVVVAAICLVAVGGVAALLDFLLAGGFLLLAPG